MQAKSNPPGDLANHSVEDLGNPDYSSSSRYSVKYTEAEATYSEEHCTQTLGNILALPESFSETCHFSFRITAGNSFVLGHGRFLQEKPRCGLTDHHLLCNPTKKLAAEHRLCNSCQNYLIYTMHLTQ